MRDGQHKPDHRHEEPEGPAATGVNVRLRGMHVDDLEFVIAQHMSHFPAGFFAKLGSRFLREYYRSFLTGPCATSLVAEQDGQQVGYLAGTVDPVEHRRHVLTRHGRAGLASTPSHVPAAGPRNSFPSDQGIALHP